MNTLRSLLTARLTQLVMRYLGAFLIALATLAGAAGVAGCATSEPFRRGTPAAQVFVDEARDYVDADEGLGDGDRVRRLDALEELGRAVNAGKLADVGAVERAWAQVRPFYVAYVSADATLDAFELELRLGNVRRFDLLIQEEKARPLRGPAPPSAPSP